jgi:hypothetical protein
VGSTWPISAALGGLGEDPERAETLAAQLTTIAPDWNCPFGGC